VSLPVTDDRKEVFFQLKALAEAVRELGPRVRWATSARFLWNLLRAGVDGLRAQLAAIEPEADDDAGLLSSIGTTTQFLHFMLSLVESAPAERVHQAMVSALEELVRALVPEPRVLVCYDWRPSNYGFRPEFPRKLRNVIRSAVLAEKVPPNTQKAANAVPGFFAVISFPSAERDNVLLHSALGHEIGHGLVEKFGKATLSVPDDIPPELASLPLTDFHLCVELRSRWLEELTADAWSACLLGPAALMSLESLARVDPPSRTHPASHLRFKVMRSCLGKTGFISDEQVIDMGWLQDVLDSVLAASDPAVKFPKKSWELAHRLLDHNVEAIANQPFEKCDQARFTATQWMHECNKEGTEAVPRHQLVRRLLYYAPPDEIRMRGRERAASLPSILNAGWCVYAASETWQEFCAGLAVSDLAGQYKARQKLHRLVLKAVDTVNITREWRRRR